MPGPIKCIWIFSSASGYGWTETHYLAGPSSGQVNLKQALALMDSKICPPRRAILAGDCFIVGLRASYKTQGGIASLNQVVEYTGTVATGSASQSDSLAVQMIDSTNTRKKIIHIRGVPYSVIYGEEFAPEGVPGYGTAVAKYQNALQINNFGWPGKDPTNSVYGQVTGYTIGTGNQITFACQVAPGSAALSTLVGGNAPLTYEARISKLNNSSSVLNRTWVVTPATTGTPPVVTGLTTVRGVGAVVVATTGRFNVTIPVFIPYSVGGTAVLGERRMGKVLSHYPGRARRRPVI